MTLDDGKSAPVTLINVIEVAREDRDAFTAAWSRLAAVMASAPGFRDAQLHEALGGDARFQLVNVAHWESEQAWRDAAADPRMQEAVRRAVGDDPVLAGAVNNTALYRATLAYGGVSGSGS